MNEPIRKLIPYEEFDYQTLLGALKGYTHPRDKLLPCCVREPL